MQSKCEGEEEENSPFKCSHENSSVSYKGKAQTQEQQQQSKIGSVISD